MTPEQSIRYLADKRKEIDNLVHRVMPRIVGKLAVDQIDDNFRRGGFVNNGFHPWKTTRRQMSGGRSAADQYGPLLSKRNRLSSATVSIPGDSRVVIRNATSYAAVHNFGGIATPTVTPKMRRFAWARYYSEKGNDKTPSPEALRWKHLALTKKTRLSIRIPQRQFLGKNKELADICNDSFNRQMEKLFK